MVTIKKIIMLKRDPNDSNIVTKNGLRKSNSIPIEK